MDFATRIKELRKLYGMRQADLADVVHLEPSTVGKWEQGKTFPNQNIFDMLCEYFGVSSDYLLGKTDDPSNAYTPTGVVTFCVLGSVRAGYDGSVEEFDSGEKITVPEEMLMGRPASDFFVLRVRGNSMYPKILDGDNVLVLRTDSVDSGSVAVIMYNGDEATLKKVVYAQGEEWVDLVPYNPEFETRRIFANEFTQVRVLGRAIRLMRDI